jgi:hypothetical protein
MLPSEGRVPSPGLSDAAGPTFAVGAIARQPAALDWMRFLRKGKVSLKSWLRPPKTKALLTSAGFSFRKNTPGKVSYEICRD